MQDPAFGSGLTLEANVFEESRVPQRIKIALDCGGIVNVANAGENVDANNIAGDAAVPMGHDFNDDIRLLLTHQRTRHQE